MFPWQPVYVCMKQSGSGHKNKNMRKLAILTVLLIIISGVAFQQYGRSYWYPYYLKFKGSRTVSDVASLYETSAFARIEPKFTSVGVSFPPSEVALLAFKDTKLLELWARDGDTWELIKSYPVLAASGNLGPKLQEGDRQVPEGIYRIQGLNPNSSYHLSMKLDYPNPVDLVHAKREGRSSPGTNIFVHGKAVSIGCLAMGDTAIEELFLLTNKVGRKNVSVIISPTDPRIQPLVNTDSSRPWVSDLYENITNSIFEITDKRA